MVNTPMAREKPVAEMVHPLDHVEVASGEEMLRDEQLDELADEQFFDPDGEVGQSSAHVAMVVCILLIVAWTGFFIWANLSVLNAVTAPADAAALIGLWALPVSLIGIGWLVWQRNSVAEGRRFANIALRMEQEGAALEERLRTINGELSIARSFLTEQTQALEAVGRHAGERLSEHGRNISASLSESEEKARRLEEVSNAAYANLDMLRKQLPVITAAAKDVTNQIGNAGRAAQTQLAEVSERFANMEERGEALGGNVASQLDNTARSFADMEAAGQQLSERLGAQIGDIDGRLDALSGKQQMLGDLVDRNFTTMKEGSSQLENQLFEQAERIVAQVDAARMSLEEQTQRTLADLEKQVADLENALSAFGQTASTEDAKLRNLMTEVRHAGEQANERISRLDSDGRQVADRISGLLSEVGQHSENVGTALSENDALVARLAAQMGELHSSTEREKRMLAGDVSDALDELVRKFAAFAESNAREKQRIADMGSATNNVAARLEAVRQTLATQAELIDQILAHGDRGLDDQNAKIASLVAAIDRMGERSAEVTGEAQRALAHATESVDMKLSGATDNARRRLEEVVESSVQSLGSLGEERLTALLEERISTASGILEQRVDAILSASDQRTDMLETKLKRLSEMTGNLEARITHARDHFEGVGDDSFARRMALLAESLNSAAIDVAKIFSNDVTDIAWAAYLKGDRGIFTRRAVRLLDNADSKAVVDQYEADSEFRSQVNRYIHDFEAMMRNLLSTRDGHAIGVTLLSSDVGKLYVALAQAIDRLR